MDYNFVVSLNKSTEGGNLDGALDVAQFSSPNGLCNYEGITYVCDSSNHRIRAISADGEVTTLAGSTAGYEDGTGSEAKFHFPTGLCIDLDGNLIVADRNNHKIRKVTLEGEVTTVAGSMDGYKDAPVGDARFFYPSAVCVDSENNILVADRSNHVIRKIAGGMVSTWAGTAKQGYLNGPKKSAQFYCPSGICIDIHSNVIVSDYGNNRIRSISPRGRVTTIAGSSAGSNDGPVSSAKFFNPMGICMGKDGIVVADFGNHKIRVISPSGLVTTLAGSFNGFGNGYGLKARFNYPKGVCVSGDGTILVSDSSNHCLRKILLSDYQIQSKLDYAISELEETTKAIDTMGGCMKTEVTAVINDHTTEKVEEISTKINCLEQSLCEELERMMNLLKEKDNEIQYLYEQLKGKEMATAMLEKEIENVRLSNELALREAKEKYAPKQQAFDFHVEFEGSNKKIKCKASTLEDIYEKISSVYQLDDFRIDFEQDNTYYQLEDIFDLEKKFKLRVVPYNNKKAEESFVER